LFQRGRRKKPRNLTVKDDEHFKSGQSHPAQPGSRNSVERRSTISQVSRESLKGVRKEHRDIRDKSPHLPRAPRLSTDPWAEGRALFLGDSMIQRPGRAGKASRLHTGPPPPGKKLLERT